MGRQQALGIGERRRAIAPISDSIHPVAANDDTRASPPPPPSKNRMPRINQLLQEAPVVSPDTGNNAAEHNPDHFKPDNNDCSNRLGGSTNPQIGAKQAPTVRTSLAMWVATVSSY